MTLVQIPKYLQTIFARRGTSTQPLAKPSPMNSVSPPWIWRSSSDEHEVFHLPDRCSNPEKPLAATATTVTLPANLLQPNRT